MEGIKDACVLYYGVWINGRHWDFDTWYGYGSVYKRVRRGPLPNSFYLEIMRQT